MTREHFEAGPQFEPTPIHGEALCSCCRALDHLDVKTGLCRPCFRVYRFSISVMHPWLLQPTFMAK